MFYDRAKIHVKAGDGGMASFLPAGKICAGGRTQRRRRRPGRQHLFKADHNLHTLLDFKMKQHYKATRGSHGQGGNRPEPPGMIWS